MKIDIVTIFPRFFDSPLQESIISRARERDLLRIDVHDLRDYTIDRHRMTDDYPYGGGAGMVMKPEPIFAAVEALKERSPGSRVTLFSPRGRTWNHERAREYSRLPEIILLCGRYEGEDERVRTLVDDEISIGDFVITGGETAALVLIESTARLLPDVVGDPASVEEDSFYRGILDYPQYTRPPVFRGLEVPAVLLSGNHAVINRWRRKEALRATLTNRPDLLDTAPLSDLDHRILDEIRSENGRE